MHSPLPLWLQPLPQHDRLPTLPQDPQREAFPFGTLGFHPPMVKLDPN